MAVNVMQLLRNNDQLDALVHMVRNLLSWKKKKKNLTDQLISFSRRTVIIAGIASMNPDYYKWDAMSSLLQTHVLRYRWVL
jgi:hypothetical protein